MNIIYCYINMGVVDAIHEKEYSDVTNAYDKYRNSHINTYSSCYDMSSSIVQVKYVAKKTAMLENEHYQQLKTLNFGAQLSCICRLYSRKVLVIPPN